MISYDFDAKKSTSHWNLGDVFFDIGLSFFEGKDCQQSDHLAAIWFALAAAKRNTGAQINLSMMLGEGRGVPVNVDWALNLAGVIANSGNQGAMRVVEVILELSDRHSAEKLSKSSKH